MTIEQQKNYFFIWGICTVITICLLYLFLNLMGFPHK